MTESDQPRGSEDVRLLVLCRELTEKNKKLETESRTLGKQNVELVFKVGDLDKQRQTAVSERDALQADKAALKSELAAVQAHSEALEARLAEQEEQARQKLAEQTRQAQEELRRELEGQAERLGREFSRGRDTLETELESALGQVRDLQAELQSAQGECESLTSRVSALEADLSRTEERLAAQTARCEELESALETVRRDRDRDLAALREKLDERSRLIEELEETVNALKEQFMASAEISLERPRPARAEASPRDVLRYLAERSLGSTGRILVDSIYARLELSADCRDGGGLGEVVAQLEDYSQSLASPEQLEELKVALAQFRGYLSHPEDCAQLLPTAAEGESESVEADVQAAGPVVGPGPGEAPPAADEAPVPDPGADTEATPPADEAVAPQPDATGSSSEAAEAAPEADFEGSAGEVAEVATMEVAVDASASESTPPPVEAAPAEPEASPSPAPPEPPPALDSDSLSGEASSGERPAITPPEPEGLVRIEEAEEEVPAETLVSATDPALRERIEEGMKLLGVEKYEQSLDLFLALYQEHPNCLEVLTGLFFNYVGFDCYMEAHEFGLRLMPILLNSDGHERFSNAMSNVLKARLDQTRNLAEKKNWLLQLAELHLDKPQTALKYLRQAQRIPDEIPGDGRISFYLTRLLADTKEERHPYLITYMARVADSRDVFRHISEIYDAPRFRGFRPTLDLILALGCKSRAEVEQLAEKATGFIEEPSPQLLESCATPQERSLLESFLDRLFPAAQLTARFPSPQLAPILNASVVADPDWGPALYAQELRQSILGSKQALQVLCYDQAGGPLVVLSPESQWRLALHRSLGNLPPAEARFLIARRLFQGQRRHLEIFRAHESLDDAARRQLAQAMLQSGPDLSPALQREAEKVLGQSEEISLGQWRSLLDRLYNQTRHDEFRNLYRFLGDSEPFPERLDAAADQFGARVVGLAPASYALCRGRLDAATMSRVEREGFQSLYEAPLATHRYLRLRLQRVWLAALQLGK